MSDTAHKLASIKIDDTIAWRHGDTTASGIVRGWCDEIRRGEWQKVAIVVVPGYGQQTIALSAVVQRTRRNGSEQGTITW